MVLIRRFYWLIMLGLLAACAHVVNPDGGAKDSKAPIMLGASPVNGATGIRPKEIKIQFDEFVQVLNTDAIICSPPLQQNPIIKAKNKSVRIGITDTLQANTTYSINFGDVITDITERNPVKNFSYVFSTGDFIDTAFLAGTLVDARSTRPLKDYLVMVYRDLSDSAPLKKLPYYFTKTDADGHWRINHIKNGSYRVFALKDENSNYLFDQENERIAFADSIVLATGNGATLRLSAFQNKESNAKVLSCKTIVPGLQQVILSKALPFVKPTVSILRAKYPIEVDLNYSNDTLLVYSNYQERDSIILSIVQEARIDTIAWEVKAVEDALQWKKSFKATASLNTQPVGRLSKNILNANAYLPNQDLCLSFSRPIPVNVLLGTTVLLQIDSIHTQLQRIDSSDISADRMHVCLKNSRLPQGDFKLIVPATEYYDTLKFTLHRATEEERASLQLHLDQVASNKLLFLLLNDQVQYRFKADQQDISIKHLWPGSYKVMILDDRNANGIWDSGDYLQHQQAEPVYYLPASILVKANWEVVQEIKMPN